MFSGSREFAMRRYDRSAHARAPAGVHRQRLVEKTAAGASAGRNRRIAAERPVRERTVVQQRV